MKSIRLCVNLAAAILIPVLLMSCRSVESTQRVIRYKGHYTMGAGPAVFVPDQTQSKRMLVLPNDIPMSVYDYLKSQPSYSDASRESASVSAFVDAEGIVTHHVDGTEEFRAVRVFSIEPAKKAYVEGLGNISQ